LRHDLISQIPELKRKYLKYETFKNETITDIFTPEQLSKAVKLDVYQLSTSILINEGHGKFTLKPLPKEAQFSCTYGIEITDMDRDGNKDIVLGGNLYGVKPEAGRYDASYGLVLKGNGKGDFTSLTSNESGISVQGEVRDIITLESAGQPIMIISRNNDSVVTYKINQR
jgi:hypothetical protein